MSRSNVQEELASRQLALLLHLSGIVRQLSGRIPWRDLHGRDLVAATRTYELLSESADLSWASQDDYHRGRDVVA